MNGSSFPVLDRFFGRICCMVARNSLKVLEVVLVDPS